MQRYSYVHHKRHRKTLKEAAESFQVITIFGSRQMGKTTTADRLFGDSFSFVTLDDPDELSLALSNPKGFLDIHRWPLIIDEVQKAPGLLNVIKMMVDEQIRNWMRNNEERKLMYVLTGSNQFELQQGISESPSLIWLVLHRWRKKASVVMHSASI